MQKHFRRLSATQSDMKKKQPMWQVYILQCSDNSLYTGITTNVMRRVNEHNRKKGGAYTMAHLPVKLVYQESRETKSRALKRESEIKRWTKKNKQALISAGKAL